MADLKVAVVTGAMGALGMPVSAELARQGFRVVLVGRGADRLAEAKRRVSAESGSAAVDSVECDLSSLRSVRAAATELCARYPKIHLLLNNAAAFSGARQLTAEGYEKMVATNHLAPFLLTTLLEKPLFAAGDARVLSMTMPSKKAPPFDDFMSEKKFASLDTFIQSKGLGQYFVRELAERWRGKVGVFAVNPDMTRTTLVKEAPLPLRVVFALFGATPEKAKSTIIRAAVSPEFNGQTGVYVGKKKAKTFSAGTEDAGVRQKLWALSEKLTGGAQDNRAVRAVA
jgi:NAD(P)-dependent dehydrogenase (short-subunit alcohol dehydrogenase family)